MYLNLQSADYDERELLGTCYFCCTDFKCEGVTQKLTTAYHQPNRTGEQNPEDHAHLVRRQPPPGLGEGGCKGCLKSPFCTWLFQIRMLCMVLLSMYFLME